MANITLVGGKSIRTVLDNSSLIQIDQQTRSFTERCSKKCQIFFFGQIQSYIRDDDGNKNISESGDANKLVVNLISKSCPKRIFSEKDKVYLWKWLEAWGWMGDGVKCVRPHPTWRACMEPERGILWAKVWLRQPAGVLPHLRPQYMPAYKLST